MNNNIFNQLMELFDEVEQHLYDRGDHKYAEAFRQKVSKIVDPLNDQLIDWRLDPEPPTSDTCDVCGTEVPSETATVVLGPDGGVFCDDKCAAIKRMSNRLYDRPPKVVERDSPERKWTVTVNGVDGVKVHTFDTAAEAQHFADAVYEAALDRREDGR